MGEHVVIRALGHLTGDEGRPRLGVGIETRDRPGPAYKAGVFSDDVVWVQLHGGLFVARARVRIAWRGEYSRVDEIRMRAEGAPVAGHEEFWAGRPRVGYAVVAQLDQERWIDPFWGGPRTYGYEWVVLESDSKRASWLTPKEPPRGGGGLARAFATARAAGFHG